MNIIFQVNGGVGKSVMATSVCKSIKIKYPGSKLIVITAYPDIFLNNPNVDICLGFNDTKYFFKHYIENSEFIYMGQEPYQSDLYYHNDTNLIEIWCDLYKLPVSQLHGEIFLTKREIEFYSRKYQFKKPILVIQTSGSAGELSYNWGRDIPPTFVNLIIDKYRRDYDIVHIRNENQIEYDGTISFTDNIRAVTVLISMSQKRIFMDSSCQHIASSLGMSSNVLWVTTSPKVFGYELNNNILSKPETKPVSLSNSFLSKYDLVPNISEFPYYDESEIFDYETLNLFI